MTFKTLIFALATLAAGAQASEFKPVLNADLRGGYATTVGGSGAGLALLDLNFVPALRFGSRSFLPTLYAGSSGQERSIAEGTTFVRGAKAGFRPSLVTELEGGYTYTLRLAAHRDWNLETLGETWGSGFYDYEQYGGGAAFSLPVELLGFGLSVGADLGHRSYPNNHNIPAAAALTNGKNYYFKDYSVTNGEVVASFGFLGMQLAYRPEYQAYTDCYVVVKGGTTDVDQLKRVLLQSLDLSLAVPLGGDLALNVSLNGSLNDSNQAAFDLAANRFVPDVEDYSTAGLNLSLPLNGDALWNGLSAGLGYSLLLRQTQKPVQDSSGAYTADKQADVEHGFSLGLSKALPWGLRWVADGSYRMVRSNQAFERGTLNSYDYWQATTGFSFAFAADEGGEEAGQDEDEDEDIDDPEFSGEPEPEAQP